MDADSSSAAAETVSTFADACSDAPATAADWLAVRSAVEVMVSDEAVISAEAEETSLTTRPTEASKESASASMAFRFSASACFSFSACSASSRTFSWALFLKIWTAPAISPISSPRPRAGTSASRSPCARRCMAPVMLRIGRLIPRLMRTANSNPISSATAVPDARIRLALFFSLAMAAFC